LSARRSMRRRGVIPRQCSYQSRLRAEFRAQIDANSLPPERRPVRVGLSPARHMGGGFPTRLRSNWREANGPKSEVKGYSRCARALKTAQKTDACLRQWLAKRSRVGGVSKCGPMKSKTPTHTTRATKALPCDFSHQTANATAASTSVLATLNNLSWQNLVACTTAATT